MEAKVKADKNIIRIIKGSVFSILITLILLFIYAILLTSTNIPESTMSVVVITITGISILIGSSISSFKIKKRGRYCKWWISWIDIYYYNIFNFKYCTYGIFNEYNFNYYAYSCNCNWNDRRNNRC